jgi:hypothetical protein
MQHHSQRLSSAALMGDADAICKKISALKQRKHASFFAVRFPLATFRHIA